MTLLIFIDVSQSLRGEFQNFLQTYYYNHLQVWGAITNSEKERVREREETKKTERGDEKDRERR